MFSEYLKALSLILMAEMGDKTQIIAIAFATQYLLKDILFGVALGAGANHAIAIILGSLLTKVIPLDLLSTLAGLLFIYFGLQSLEIEDEEDEESSKKNLSPLLTVALAFFLGELGDKTQLSALTLSLDSNYPFVVLLGTTSGMVLTSLFGIIVGKKLGKKIPEFQMKIGAFIIFSIFGVEKLFNSVYRERISPILQILIFGILVAYLIYKLVTFNSEYRELANSGELTLLQKRAEYLYELQHKVLKNLENICINQGKCENCIGNGCVVNYMKVLTNSAIFNNEPLKDEEFINIENLVISKSHDKLFAASIIEDIDSYIKMFPQERDNRYLQEILTSCEKIVASK